MSYLKPLRQELRVRTSKEGKKLAFSPSGEKPTGSKEGDNRFHRQKEWMDSLQNLFQQEHCEAASRNSLWEEGPSCHPDLGTSMALGRRAGFKLRALFQVYTDYIPVTPPCLELPGEGTDILT